MLSKCYKAAPSSPIPWKWNPLMSKRKITVIPGDGIGPSIIESAIQILTHAGCDFEYEYADAGLVALEKHGELLPQATLELIEKNKVSLKGPLTTPVGGGFSNIGVPTLVNRHGGIVIELNK